jgi:hypothetical protein
MLGSRRGQCVISQALGPRPSIPIDSVTHVVNIPVDSRASALDTSFCSPPSYRPAPVRWGFFFYDPEIFFSIPDPDPNNAPKWPRPDSRTASKASRTEVPEKMAPEHRPSDATERAPRPSNKNRHRSEVLLTQKIFSEKKGVIGKFHGPWSAVLPSFSPHKKHLHLASHYMIMHMGHNYLEDYPWHL